MSVRRTMKVVVDIYPKVDFKTYIMYCIFFLKQYVLLYPFNPLTHWGRPIGPSIFGRPVPQKVLMLKIFRSISYSMEINSALKLS